MKYLMTFGLFGGVSLVISLLYFGFSFIIGAYLFPYIVLKWSLYIMGYYIFMPWYIGGFIGLIPGAGLFSIPLSIITFIIFLFI